MNWIEVVKQFGVPFAGMVVLLLFFQRSVWPFITARMERAEARLDNTQAKFDLALERRDGIALETVKALAQINENLRDLNEEVRRQRQSVK